MSQLRTRPVAACLQLSAYFSSFLAVSWRLRVSGGVYWLQDEIVPFPSHFWVISFRFHQTTKTGKELWTPVFFLKKRAGLSSSKCYYGNKHLPLGFRLTFWIIIGSMTMSDFNGCHLKEAGDSRPLLSFLLLHLFASCLWLQTFTAFDFTGRLIPVKASLSSPLSPAALLLLTFRIWSYRRNVCKTDLIWSKGTLAEMTLSFVNTDWREVKSVFS